MYLCWWWRLIAFAFEFWCYILDLSLYVQPLELKIFSCLLFCWKSGGHGLLHVHVLKLVFGYSVLRRSKIFYALLTFCFLFFIFIIFFCEWVSEWMGEWECLCAILFAGFCFYLSRLFYSIRAAELCIHSWWQFSY